MRFIKYFFKIILLLTLIISTTSCVGGGAGHGNESTKNSPPSLSSIHVTSNNTDQNLAEPGNTITVTFTASESMNGHKILINGHEAVITRLSGKSYKADYTLTTSESEGEITIELVLSNSTPKILSVNNNNLVTIANMPPATPSSITLKVPSFSPAGNLTPEFTIAGIEVGATVDIFSDACTTSIGSAVANATTIDVTSSALSLGTYTIYARQTDEDGNISACSSETASYKLNQPFVSSWDTTAPNETITLPLRSGYTYAMNVDWGDGSPIAEITSDSDGDKIHTYASAGTYTITLGGIAETLYFNNTSGDKGKIKTISNLGDMGWTTFEGAFAGCNALSTVDGGVTSDVTSMKEMFMYATLAVPDGSEWDTSKVTNMEKMFNDASNANPDTTAWNVENVTAMTYMFGGASNANPGTTNWDVSNVSNMSGLFSNATSATPNTTEWNTNNVTNMYDMFYGATIADPITTSWNTNNVTDMAFMFRDATTATPVTTSWNTVNVTTMRQMFRSATSANPVTTFWNTINVTDMEGMFRDATTANPVTTSWNTVNVTSMRQMFRNAIAADPNTSNWDLNNLSTPVDMFLDATGLSNANYSSFLIQLNSGHNVSGTDKDITVDAAVKYQPAAAAARTNLLGSGWTISDGGAE